MAHAPRGPPECATYQQHIGSWGFWIAAIGTLILAGKIIQEVAGQTGLDDQDGTTMFVSFLSLVLLLMEDLPEAVLTIVFLIHTSDRNLTPWITMLLSLAGGVYKMYDSFKKRVSLLLSRGGSDQSSRPQLLYTV